MQTSIIRHRVADFLKRHSPFDAFLEKDLLDLAGSGRVRFHESGEYIFRQGDAKGQFVWIIQQGRVELLEERSAGERLRDVLGEGDLLGLERFAGDGSCAYSARTATDVILYGVAASVFESLVPRYTAVQRFLSAHFSLAGALTFGKSSWLDAEAPSVDFLRAGNVVLPRDTSTTEAAAQLAGARNGVATLVDDSGRPVGIITALELCTANAGPARAAARPCPPAVIAPVTTRAAVREMLRARSEELTITVDGTSESGLEAILTASELALFSGYNPSRLVNMICQATSVAEMVPLLERTKRAVRDGLAQPLDVDDCCRIGTEVVTATACACIRLAHTKLLEAGMTQPEIPSCWVMFGAPARGDRLLPGLPAVAVVYDNSDESFRPEDSLYFAALAGETMLRFHACGLTGLHLLWPEGSQPSMPLSEWRRFYCETIRNPVGHDLYVRREFFDLQPLSGDPSIFQKLKEHILLELRDHEMAVPLLANDTLVRLPPLTFFRGLVLDLDGAQQDSFDIASTAIIPIADAARVFAIAKRRLAPANTLERLAAAELDFPEGATIFHEAAGAFRTALYYQTLAGALEQGARIDPGKLGKFDQLLLKTAFSSIQRLLEFTTSTFIPTA
jgi:CBS domain-containing protein